jgi:hypothetical protein
MNRTANISEKAKPKKNLFPKRLKKKTKKEKIERFVVSFYTQYGNMMSQLSNE